MELCGLVIPTDGRELFREIARTAIEGHDSEPRKAAAVKLFGPNDPISPDGSVSNLFNSLRSGLASVNMGRFSVSHKSGDTAFVTVNEKAPRTRAKKAAPKTPKVK